MVEIGEDAFRLSENAYVVCTVGSKAFSYCKQYALKNSVGYCHLEKIRKVSALWWRFLVFFKKCKMCGIDKDY